MEKQSFLSHRRNRRQRKIIKVLVLNLETNKVIAVLEVNKKNPKLNPNPIKIMKMDP